jgi:hypothetical protein
MRPGFVSPPDPYLFREFADWPGGGNKNVAGRTIRDPRLDLGETTGIFIVAGQSNACNAIDGAYVPTNGAKIDNLNFYDGGTYAAADPLLGAHGEVKAGGPAGNLFLPMADKLITDGVFDRVILIPVGIGGTLISEWAAEPGVSRIVAGHRRAAAHGWSVTAILFMQGESDNNPAGTSQSAYAASMATMLAALPARGVTAPWLIARCTYISGATSSGIRAAQAAAVNGTTVFAGPDTDTLTSSHRQADNTHFDEGGGIAAGNLWAAAVNAVF